MQLEGVLSCSVRGCEETLARRGTALVCARGHAFDTARSGYVNLLQPQDRRSRNAGDGRAEVEARARLLAAGWGRRLDAELMRRIEAAGVPTGALAVELGSGSGERLDAICARFELQGIGIDLSASAAAIAARRYPARTWLVANADRRLPLADGVAALVLSIHGRRNPRECARVLPAGGLLVAAMPAPDDLRELRALVQGAASPRERARGFLDEHAGGFACRSRSKVCERRDASREELLDLLAGTYRGARRSLEAAVARLERLEVTAASEVLVLQRE